MKTAAALALAGSLVLTTAATADVLWDQSALSGTTSSVPNTISGGPPFGSTVYAVSDVVVPAGGWTITSISTFFSRLGFADWSTDVTTARLNIFSRTGSLPAGGDNPGAGTVVSIFCTPSTFDAGPGFGEQGVWVATASGLNITLAPGDYWIGLTPVAPGGFDLEYNWPSSAVVGLPSAMRSPFSGFGMPPANTWSDSTVEGSILIQGVPAPSAAAALGLAGLAACRRRR
ncbi:MAG TPA: hypothetical protein VFF65_10600 [Phycisphaerales bacterium]|nr:hypothetical protein [Phycisphaerales bacterium]